MKKLLLAAAIAATMMTAPARAAEITFSATLVDQDGNAIKDSEGKVLTLGRASMLALMAGYPDDVAVPTEEKARRGYLGLKVYQADKVDLPAEDVALIKKYLGKLYPPLIVVRALPLLDPPAPAKK